MPVVQTMTTRLESFVIKFVVFKERVKSFNDI